MSDEKDLDAAIQRLEAEPNRARTVALDADLRTVIAATKRLPLTDATREQVEKAVRFGIGYAPVPLSIRDHPEITSEYRTAEDADGLVKRITDAILVEFRPVASTRERLADVIGRALLDSELAKKVSDEEWKYAKAHHGPTVTIALQRAERSADAVLASGAVEDRADVKAKALEAAAYKPGICLASSNALLARAASIREGRS